MLDELRQKLIKMHTTYQCNVALMRMLKKDEYVDTEQYYRTLLADELLWLTNLLWEISLEPVEKTQDYYSYILYLLSEYAPYVDRFIDNNDIKSNSAYLKAIQDYLNLFIADYSVLDPSHLDERSLKLRQVYKRCKGLLK